MMSSDEMYALGVHDAEHNTPNFFYYQHYYHYRRGYDQTRFRQSIYAQLFFRFRWPVFSGILLGLMVLGTGYWLLSAHSRDTLSPRSVLGTPTHLVTEIATPTPTLSPTPIPPTPTPSPEITIGATVVVTNVGDMPLRGRRDPGIAAPALIGFPGGSRLKVLDGPVEKDGYRWWKVEGTQGSGWCAEQGAEEIIWLSPIAPEE